MSQTDAQAVAAPTSQRILSIDVLRGFDMFWIIGGEALAMAVLPFCGRAVHNALQPQLDHAEWSGFRFYDLIFPLFIFVVGMSAVLSLGKTVSQYGMFAAYRRIIQRTILLFLLGIFYSGGLTSCWPDVRLLGVLQRIALCYLFTSILCMHLQLRGIIITLVVLLVGYWAWLSFVPVPGLGSCSFEPGLNWSNYLDSKYLPGRKYDGTWDPEGYLSTLPAIATCLLGVLAVRLLKNPRLTEWGKVGCLIGGGLVCLLGGYCWGMQFPIVKKIWTSSFVLVAGGYSMVLLGLFYMVIDVWKLQRWAIPFTWIGTNAIALYMVRNMVDFDALARRIVGCDVQSALGQRMGGLLLAGVSVGMILALARLMYRNKIFLRV